LPQLKMLLRDSGMDFAMLAAVQLCFGRIYPKRLITSLCLLQLSTLIYILFGSFALHPLLPLFFGISAGYILLPAKRFRDKTSCMLCLMIVPAASAGLMHVFGDGFSAAAVIPILISIPVLMRRRMHINYRWNIEALIENNGKQIVFDALIDTGNRLREPISGLPVMIVAADLFPPGFAAETAMRPLSFSVLGSSGEIKAFRTSAVQIRNSAGSFRSAPECYVALFPGRMPGKLKALAPPEFTEVLEPVTPFLKRCRRRRRKKTCHFPASDNPFTAS